MDINEFVAQFAEIVSEDGIMSDTELADIKGWDSLSQVTFIAFVRRQFGNIVNVSKLQMARTIRELYDIARGN